jgi:hypothetical protein
MIEKKILNSSRIFLIIICSLIILTAVFLAGLFWGQNTATTAYQMGYQTAWSTAQRAVEESGYFAPEAEEVFEIFGTIVNINNNKKSITIESEPYSDNPLADTGAVLKEIMVDDHTLFYINTPKSFEEFQTEVDAHDAALLKLGRDEIPPEPPLIYNSEKVAFENLSLGDYIGALAETNIKGLDEFTASEINVYLEPEEEPPLITTEDEAEE